MVRSWWVNQNEKRGGRDNAMVWAPSQSEGVRAPHWSWRNLLEVGFGDLIFHYTDRHVVGFSRAVATAHNFENPYEGDAEWQQQGWRLPVEYRVLARPLHIADIPEDIRKDNHSSLGGPFDKNLRPIQGYLLPVRTNLARVLLEIIGFDIRESSSLLSQESSTLAGFENTDRLIQSLARVEQQKLCRILLKGAESVACGLCGLETDAKYLVAAHIKPRSLCSNSERRDLDNAMLACVFGCDAAFENGGLKVAEEGKILVEDDLRKSRPGIYNRIHGGIAPAFTQGTRVYFEAKAASLNE